MGQVFVSDQILVARLKTLLETEHLLSNKKMSL